MSDSLTRDHYCSLCYTTYTLTWSDGGNCFELRCPRPGCAAGETPAVLIPRYAFEAMGESKRAALLKLWPDGAEWPIWMLPYFVGGGVSGPDSNVRPAMLEGGLLDSGIPYLLRSGPSPEQLVLPPLPRSGCEMVQGTPVRPGFAWWRHSLDASDLVKESHQPGMLAVVDEPGWADESPIPSAAADWLAGRVGTVDILRALLARYAGMFDQPLDQPTIVLGQADEALRTAFEAGGFTVLRRRMLPTDLPTEQQAEQHTDWQEKD